MKLGDRANYIFLILLLYPVSLLPLKALYILSDIIAWIGQYIIGYRKKVIRENLSGSFPDMSKDQLRVIEIKYYHFLADYIVETIKLLTISEEGIRRRMIVENPELISADLQNGHNISLLLGHYGNWEWVSSLPLYFPQYSICAQIYHPLHNQGMDRIFKKIRTRFHAHNIPMHEIARKLIHWKQEGIPSVTGYIADQSPEMSHLLFLNFLNHETAVYTGPERLSCNLNAKVYYCHIFRQQRGIYHLSFQLISDSPQQEEEYHITKRYFELLEENILEAPQYWLWSHRRWKITPEKYKKYWSAKSRNS